MKEKIFFFQTWKKFQKMFHQNLVLTSLQDIKNIFKIVEREEFLENFLSGFVIFFSISVYKSY